MCSITFKYKCTSLAQSYYCSPQFVNIRGLPKCLAGQLALSASSWNLLHVLPGKVAHLGKREDFSSVTISAQLSNLVKDPYGVLLATVKQVYQYPAHLTYCLYTGCPAAPNTRLKKSKVPDAQNINCTLLKIM